jgi:hypothetical protein
MPWRFSSLPAGFLDGVSGTRIWPSTGFSKSTITNDDLEMKNSMGPKTARQNFPRTPQRLSYEKDHQVRGLDLREIRSRNYF